MVTRANKRKFHYIYKITRNDGSGKFYIGLHSTDDLEDGYFGSGKLLWRSIAKHGKEKHSKEILEFLPSREALKFRERQIVNEELITNPLCMNLKLGGEGGGKFKDKVHQQKATAASNISPKRNRIEAARKCQATLDLRGTRSGGGPNFAGKRHSTQTKMHLAVVMAAKQSGNANSQFGTCWVTNGLRPVKIKKEQLDEFLLKGYRRGRIIVTLPKGF